jgi:hypothetical protein
MLKKETTETHAAAVETPQAATTLSPEAVVEQLRTLQVQIGELTPLSSQEREALRRDARTSNEILQASINVIGAASQVEQAIGRQAADVREMYDEANRWSAVEDELRKMLKGVAGTNLVRFQRIARIAKRAYGIGVQLASDPDHVALVTHVQEVKRLKRIARRKKTQAPTPAPAPGTQSPDGSSGKHGG